MVRGNQIIDDIAEQLLLDNFESSAPRNFEARLIAEHITGCTYSQLIMSDVTLNQIQQSQIGEIVAIRNQGRPLPYILNNVSFCNLDLYVDERVLIPRSETELVVEYAIGLVKTHDHNVTVLDIGTGSGAIGLSIAHECKKSQVVATDISTDALEVARLNGIGLGSAASRIQFLQSDIYSSIPDIFQNRFELIISNPPYIGMDEFDSIPSSVIEFEPHLALFSDETGEQHYRSIIQQAHRWLTDDGSIVLEISPRHVEFIKSLSNKHGFRNCEIHKDLTGKDRICILKFL